MGHTTRSRPSAAGRFECVVLRTVVLPHIHRVERSYITVYLGETTMVGDIFLPYVCSSMATKGAPRVVNIPISWHTSLPVTRTSSQRFPGKKTIPSSSCWQLAECEKEGTWKAHICTSTSSTAERRVLITVRKVKLFSSVTSRINVQARSSNECR